MAVYRQIQVSFWQDTFVLDLTPEEKYFYLYLMTNSKTRQCGVYEVSRRVMELETGYNRETVEKLIKRFIEYGKIDYCEETKEVLLRNWFKYNSSKSPKVLQCIMSEVAKIKHLPFKEYTMDSLSIDSGEEKEKEKKEEQKKEKEQYILFVEWFNEKFKTNYKPSTYKDKINTRLKEFTLDQLKQASLAMKADKHMMGINDNKKVYATIEYITRNEKNVDKWLVQVKPDIEPPQETPEEKARRERYDRLYGN